jgi:hypothetical protein
MVVLHKKDQAAPPVGTAAQGSSKTNPRLKGTVKAVQRGGRNVRAGQAQQGEFITFRVYERRYKNAELGLDFYIDSADQKQFVYWMNPPGPKHMYALPYVSENHYDAHKDEGIRALDVAQEGADPADPKEVHHHPRRRLRIQPREGVCGPQERHHQPDPFERAHARRSPGRPGRGGFGHDAGHRQSKRFEAGPWENVGEEHRRSQCPEKDDPARFERLERSDKEHTARGTEKTYRRPPEGSGRRALNRSPVPRSRHYLLASD